MLSSANVPRIGGELSVWAGLLMIAQGLISILLQSHFWAASSFTDYLSMALTSITFLALAGGLVGLHAIQAGRCGKMEGLEKTSFFLAVLGATLAAISSFADDWLHIPLMDWWVFMASGFILVFAGVTVGANVLPRRYSRTFAVGSLGLFLGLYLNKPLANGGMILFGLTLIVLGYAIWNDQTWVPR